MQLVNKGWSNAFDQPLSCCFTRKKNATVAGQEKR